MIQAGLIGVCNGHGIHAWMWLGGGFNEEASQDRFRTRQSVCAPPTSHTATDPVALGDHAPFDKCDTRDQKKKERQIEYGVVFTRVRTSIQTSHLANASIATSNSVLRSRLQRLLYHDFLAPNPATSLRLVREATETKKNHEFIRAIAYHYLIGPL
ncbi:hypothetical protein BX600DRAFT_312727 [Xylariales sp. PMI_506]|nr:hypothetical protein BX600DRAFT_312727 [Xylariales sp. PMI_506]